MELVRQTKQLGRLPVVNFAAGGVATPADAALMMQLGMDGVFVGSGIFKSGDPASRARAIVQVGLLPLCESTFSFNFKTPLINTGLLLPPFQAVTHYNNPTILAEVSSNLGEPMVGIDIREKDFNSYAQRSE